MFCPNCGKEITGNPKFCENCGYKLEHIENSIYSNNSYYKESYKRKPKNKEFSFGESFAKGVVAMLAIFVGLLAICVLKNNFSNDMFSLDKAKYQQYVENPSLIPELTQPESFDNLVSNLQNVQNFLALYLKFSNDSVDSKMEVFNKYRNEILKLQNFSNSNILKESAKFQIPREEKDFKKIQKEYSKQLTSVGLKLVVDDSYSKYYLKEDYKFTQKRFGKYLPEDVNNYLKLRAKHNSECIFKDKLIIKPYQLAQRIGDYEKFYKNYPEFYYENEIKDLIFSYSFIYAFNSDVTNKKYSNDFKNSNEKFIKNYSNSQLKPIFTALLNSENGITEKEFDEMYPYEYQKTLDALKPEQSDLTDIFTSVRKNIMSLKNDANYQYVYVSESNSWITYDSANQLKKGDMILALSEEDYIIFDYKYKKTNQIIKPEKDAKFFIKSGQLIVYSSKNLQLSSLESVYGGFSFRPVSIKAIKKLFPEILIINIDTFGNTSVQIDKPSGEKTYMLISTSGGNYENYKLSGNITIGELDNIFTISTDENTQVNFTSDTDGESYYMYFITQKQEQNEESVEN